MEEKINKKNPEILNKVNKFISNDNLNKLSEIIEKEKTKNFGTKPALATRQCSMAAIESISGVVPELIGGSADLSGSNNTKTNNSKTINSRNFNGNYLHYGVREHGMAAIMNGLALYGGIIPYGGTFLIFSDYCKPAIRLSALMGLKVIYIFFSRLHWFRRGRADPPAYRTACRIKSYSKFKCIQASGYK